MILHWIFGLPFYFLHQSCMRTHIKKTLKASGYKLTAPRKRVAEWIAGKKGIFSANELLDELASLDKVSVYRTLELFSRLDMIHPVLSQHGEVHYEMHGDNHHHHAVCVSCEKTTCVPCTAETPSVSGFSNMHHSFVLTGTCTSCAAG